MAVFFGLQDIPAPKLPHLKCYEFLLQTNMCKGKNQMLELSVTSGRRDRSAVSAEVTFHRNSSV